MMEFVKLASEKNLNKYIVPVIKLSNKNVIHPFSKAFAKWRFACNKGLIGSKELMILDILGTLVIQKSFNSGKNNGEIKFSDKILSANDYRVKFFSQLNMSTYLVNYIIEKERELHGGLIPEHYYLADDALEYIDGEKKRIKRPGIIKFSDKLLKHQLPFLKKYSSKRLSEIIIQLSECVVLMNYPIRLFDGKKYINIPFDFYSHPSKFFTLCNMTAIKNPSDGKIYERKYEIKFDTIWGYFFIQNCLSGYTDLVPGKFYLMTEYAQLFYRIFILPYYGSFFKYPIELKYIKSRLILKTKDKGMARKTVRRILDELEANNLISNPKELDVGGDYKYSYIKNSWKQVIK